MTMKQIYYVVNLFSTSLRGTFCAADTQSKTILYLRLLRLKRLAMTLPMGQYVKNGDKVLATN